MISLATYRLLHIVGVTFVFMALGATLLHVMSGGNRQSNSARSLVAATHGIGLTLLLIAGFGMLARLGMSWPLPLWVWAKVALWVLFGTSLSLIYRFQLKAKLIWWGTLVLGALAAGLAIFKPGI